ncbi:MAG: HU family DNA-binding protein [Candidatus Excrementavichristensenella sp.]|jgi:DNA-binding protein HU-beta|nr:HU family DNA-binding protein [Bacillota bacterium]NLL53861.1 HU family DNA-binding protein [Clostridiales bacterium]
MKKSEFIGIVAKKAGLTTAQASAAMDAVLGTITEELQNGGKVQFTGFGTFEVRVRPAYTGRNPQTGEPVEVAESKAPVFRAGKTLKAAL